MLNQVLSPLRHSAPSLLKNQSNVQSPFLRLHNLGLVIIAKSCGARAVEMMPNEINGLD
jgi:MFS superfamily sulfate permease-like transporter